MARKSENNPSQPAKAQASPERVDGFVRLLTRFNHFVADWAGVLLLALALLTLMALAMPAWTGGVLAWWGNILRVLLGWGSYWVVVAFAVAGVELLRRRLAGEVSPFNWRRVLSIEIVAFLSIALLASVGGSSLERAEAGLDGGRVGWGLAELTGMLLSSFGLASPIWRVVILSLALMLATIAAFDLVSPIRAMLRRIVEPEATQAEVELPGLGPAVSEAPLEGAETQAVLQQNRGRKRRTVLPAQFRKSFRVEPADETAASPPPRDERLPDLDLLVDERVNRPDERNINMTAGLIEKTLAEFGIPAKVVGFRIGPTVTQFAVEPGYVEKDKPGAEGDLERSKVRVSQISSLARDLALALAAERLRIEAPVPGRPYVGIEVPNTRSTVVRLRPILETEAFYKIGSPLAIAFGRDVSGLPVIADLALMPHLLIAGTTGSGKSVCIAALTTCLAMNNTPDDLRIVMVDPKMVELVRFNGLPHLYGKVETDLERILGVLRWVVTEMDRRYRLLEATRSRNIDTYNRKARRRKGVEPLPHIVLMIDELADLMMSAPDQTEHNLVRLAQMARATGIHLVIATQRPSTDVVTGLIKANFPARLSFAVASSIDSRVILDTIGAESLLGRGDMLFLPPEASGPVRVQGVMVTDQEVERVITYWRSAIQADEQVEQAPWEEMLEQEQMLADRDDLIEKAIKIVRNSQNASASMLQRRLRIGYPRAARLMDELEDLGVVGPAVGGGRQREILLSPDDDLQEWEGED